MQTLPAITRTHTKRARTQIADRPARQFVPVPLGLSPERYAFGMIYLIFTLFDIYFTAKTDMEPRQGGRFHIWHMLGRGKCLFATYALAKDGTFAAKTAAFRRPTA